MFGTWSEWRERHRSGAWRELLIAVICLLVGLLVMPVAIWAVGRAALGPYAHGGPFELWMDFLHGLRSGSRAFWFVLLGPYLLAWLLRGGYRLWSFGRTA